MAQIQCTRCGRIVNVNYPWDTQATCNNCGGYFIEIQNRNNPQFSQQYQPQRPNMLGNQFEEIGKTFQGINMPHIVIGNNGLSTNTPQNNYPVQNSIPRKNYQPYPYNQQFQANKKQFEGITDYLTYHSEKIKKWGLWIAISLVIGYAVSRLIF